MTATTSLRPVVMCQGCGRRDRMGNDWRAATSLVDTGTSIGFFIAALCPSCWPRLAADDEFRERFSRTVIATATDQWHEQAGVR